MKNCILACWLVLFGFAFASATFARQASYFKSRDIRRTPIQSVTVDNSGRLVVGGDYPLEFRRQSQDVKSYDRGTLIVRNKRSDGTVEEKYLAHVIDASGLEQLRLSDKEDDSCQWTTSRLQKTTRLGERPASRSNGRTTVIEYRVFWQESFAPFGDKRGHTLRQDLNGGLVLGNQPLTPIGGKTEFTYDDDPNDGK